MNGFGNGLNMFTKDPLILVERGSSVTSFNIGHFGKWKRK